MGKFYVCRAETPRNSPFTFKPDGFYSVLKSRVKKKLSEINHREVSIKSILVIDTWFFATLILCAAVAQTQSAVLALFAGISLGLGTVASHNFTHLKDNWRMYYMQLSLFSVRQVLYVQYIYSIALHGQSVVQVQQFNSYNIFTVIL